MLKVGGYEAVALQAPFKRMRAHPVKMAADVLPSSPAENIVIIVKNRIWYFRNVVEGIQ